MQQFSSPPAIAAVESDSRPLWSVMIPTYNNIDYLAQTLESVLAQDLGPEQMQIEVVDNASTQGDIAAFVQRVGKGRVSFYRHPQSVGGCMQNFNSCIQRSRGQLVHILHSDDYVLPGFYQAYSKAAAAHPEKALFVCRVFDVDAQGNLEDLSPRLTYLEHPQNDPSPQFYVNDIRFPGVVVRRSFYEAFGGFYEHIIHAHDWELWMRALQLKGGLAINEALACYRVFPQSSTAKLFRTAANLHDVLRVGQVFQQYANFDHRRFIADVRLRAYWRAGDFLKVQDIEAVLPNAQLWWSLATPKQRIKLLLTMGLRSDKTAMQLVALLAKHRFSARKPQPSLSLSVS